MTADDPITKVTQCLQRADGSEARIVAQAMFGAGLHRSIAVDVFRRDHAGQPWALCNDRPAPGWKAMPRAEYLAHGRSEALRTVTPGEILKVTALIGQPLSHAAGAAS